MRTHVLMAALSIASGLAHAAPRSSLVEASGRVFVDSNADGIAQATEVGVADVVVTDGERFVKTDNSGRYRIEISADDATLFIVKPRGYAVPVDEQNKPKFYYVHKPAGSPDEGFIFEGVAPTGPLPASIDFPLISTPDEPDEFSVILFGDPQPYTQVEVGYLRTEVIEPLMGVHDAAFGVSLGDLVGDHLGLYDPLNEAQALLGVPWYNVYGNHDMNFVSGSTPGTQADPDRYADETFTRVYGPANYAFQHGRAHFIVLDNVIHQGFEGYRDSVATGWPKKRRPKTSTYRGGLHPEQIAFVDRYLDFVPEDDLVVLMFHIPIEMDGDGVHRIPEKGELFAALSSHPNTLSISGHTHIQRHWFFGSDDGYAPASLSQHHELNPGRFDGPVHHHLNAVTASGSWFRGPMDETGVPFSTMACGAPNGYTLLHIDGHRYRTDFRAARSPASYQMNLSTTPRGRDNDDRILFANVFNGAPGDTVEFRVKTPGGRVSSWQPMEHTPLPDPTMSELWRSHSAIPDEHRTGRTLPRPQLSTHLWSAPLEFVDDGTHVLEVRHIDLYGKTQSSTTTFRSTTADLP